MFCTLALQNKINMSHEIDQTNGKAAIVLRNQPAWHKLGTVHIKGNESLSLDECLEDGGLNFIVSKEANSHHVPGGKIITSTNSFFTYRMDTKAVLGDKLGREYRVYQNTEALSIADALVKTGKAKIETAGALFGGSKVFVCMKLNGVINLGGKDVTEQYFVLITSHDGSCAITGIFTNVRVVCNNTLTMALNGAQHTIKIRHTENATANMAKALKLVDLMVDNQKKTEEAYMKMKKTRIDRQGFWDYVGNVFFTPEEMVSLQAGHTNHISTRKENIINKVLEAGDHGVGQALALNNGKMNMWWAYNAITNYVTNKEYKSLDHRFENMLLYTQDEVLTKAGKLAIDPSTLKSLNKISLN